MSEVLKLQAFGMSVRLFFWPGSLLRRASGGLAFSERSRFFTERLNPPSSSEVCTLDIFTFFLRWLFWFATILAAIFIDLMSEPPTALANRIAQGWHAIPFRSLREAPLSKTVTSANDSSETKTSGVAMLIAAVGVVYGDIGTSPLYTLKEVFSGHYGVQLNHDGVLGILSLIFWSLIWVVSIKYVLFILRANNQGEGGIMALTALARRAAAPYPP